MLKSVIVSAILGAAALAGGQYYATGVVPFLDAPVSVVAVAAPAPGPAAPPAVQTAAQPVFLCTPQRAPEAPPAAPAQATAAQAQTAGLVNLNTASEAELDALPDVGKARVARIVGARPIRSIDSLAGPGMPTAVIAMLKARATV